MELQTKMPEILTPVSTCSLHHWSHIVPLGQETLWIQITPLIQVYQGAPIKIQMEKMRLLSRTTFKELVPFHRIILEIQSSTKSSNYCVWAARLHRLQIEAYASNLPSVSKIKNLVTCTLFYIFVHDVQNWWSKVIVDAGSHDTRVSLKSKKGWWAIWGLVLVLKNPR